MLGLIVDIHDLIAHKGEPEVYPEKTGVRFVLTNRIMFNVEVNVEISYISRARVVDKDEMRVTLEPYGDRELHSVSDWVVESVEVRAYKGPFTLDREKTDPPLGG